MKMLIYLTVDSCDLKLDSEDLETAEEALKDEAE